MRFAVYRPDREIAGKMVPLVTFLSGLTCTEENFSVKAGAQRVASELGLLLVSPDTSPRGQNLPGEEDSYDFGSGGGFYLDATEAPWSRAYRMYSYIAEELPGVLGAHFHCDMTRQGIMGHSMGGHGALICALRETGAYRSVSAFAPICHPVDSGWGKTCFNTYLGDDREAWKAYDATELIKAGAAEIPLLIDQGTDDEFLPGQLCPEDLEVACAARGYPLTLRRQEGYDHSYHFISTFIGEHLAYHAKALSA